MWWFLLDGSSLLRMLWLGFLWLNLSLSWHLQDQVLIVYLWLLSLSLVHSVIFPLVSYFQLLAPGCYASFCLLGAVFFLLSPGWGKNVQSLFSSVWIDKNIKAHIASIFIFHLPYCMILSLGTNYKVFSLSMNYLSHIKAWISYLIFAPHLFLLYCL